METIDEVTAARQKLESDMCNFCSAAIAEFEAATGARVEDIYPEFYDNTEIYDESERYVLVKMNVHLVRL